MKVRHGCWPSMRQSPQFPLRCTPILGGGNRNLVRGQILVPESKRSGLNLAGSLSVCLVCLSDSYNRDDVIKSRGCAQERLGRPPEKSSAVYGVDRRQPLVE